MGCLQNSISRTAEQQMAGELYHILRVPSAQTAHVPLVFDRELEARPVWGSAVIAVATVLTGKPTGISFCPVSGAVTGEEACRGTRARLLLTIYTRGGYVAMGLPYLC